MVGSQRQWNLSREGRQVIKITRPPGDDLTRHRTAYDGATSGTGGPYGLPPYPGPFTGCVMVVGTGDFSVEQSRYP